MSFDVQALIRRGLARAALGAAAAAVVPGAMAAGPTEGGSDAEVRRMIESLRPASAAAAGRTRNLVIEPAAAPAAGAAPTAAQAAAASPTTSPSPSASPAAAATTAAPAAAPAASSTAPAGAGLSLAIAFEPNSALLRPESGATLGALVAAMISRELRGQRFVIEGHTDASGTPAQNLRLSRERAEQVRLYLVTLGVEGDRLRAVGKGASEPANPRDPRSPENRRVRVLAQP